jgi:2-keto-4-pentenoate hydratase
MTSLNTKETARKIFNENSRREDFLPTKNKDGTLTSLDDAYDIQDELYKIFQEETDVGPISGYKIALTSDVMQKLCGVKSPVFGKTFTKQIYKSPHTIRSENYIRLGLEFEVAFELKQDIPFLGTPLTIETIGEYIESCMPSFEIIDDRNADYNTLDAASILMDRCWCAGIVLGAPVADWSSLDLAHLSATHYRNGVLSASSITGDALGHPLEGLVAIVNHERQRGNTLKKGDIFITGSSQKTEFAEAGDFFEFKIDGLGSVSLQIE